MRLNEIYYALENLLDEKIAQKKWAERENVSDSKQIRRKIKSQNNDNKSKAETESDLRKREKFDPVLR